MIKLCITDLSVKVANAVLRQLCTVIVAKWIYIRQCIDLIGQYTANKKLVIYTTWHPHAREQNLKQNYLNRQKGKAQKTFKYLKSI